jgi:hypothetical protein
MTLFEQNCPFTSAPPVYRLPESDTEFRSLRNCELDGCFDEIGDGCIAPGPEAVDDVVTEGVVAGGVVGDAIGGLEFPPELTACVIIGATMTPAITVTKPTMYAALASLL